MFTFYAVPSSGKYKCALVHYIIVDSCQMTRIGLHVPIVQSYKSVLATSII